MRKSRLVAALLGFLVPGLGHMFVGHTLRGVGWALAPFIAFVLYYVTAGDAPVGRTFLALFGCALLGSAGGLADLLFIPPDKHRKTNIPAIVILGALVVLSPFLVAIGLRIFIVEAFRVPSGSMMPSVLIGDHLFADKRVYRKRGPRRGEIVIFKYPEHPEQLFVKRAIALGGDKLEFRNGHPIINGWEVPSCRVGEWEYAEPDDGTKHSGELFVEFLDASAHLVFFDRLGLDSDYQGPYYAKPGETWVAGDNRNNAHDSRMWFGGTGGGVSPEHLGGRATLVWLGGAPGRIGLDLTTDPVAPTPALEAPVAACLAKRPAVTLPPKGQ